MVRDDDFGEVPNLGPARDELDKPSRPSPRPRPTPASPPTGPQPGARGSGNGLIYLLLLLLVLVIAGLGYLGWQREQLLQQQWVQMTQQQMESAHKIAVLENLISATDESVSKSGAALQGQLRQLLNDRQQRLKHVDSEIAKLWAVAHQRNSPKIDALEKGAAALQQSLSELQQRLSAEADRLDQLRAQQASSDKILAGTGSAVGELNAGYATLQERFEQLAQQVQIRDQANQELDELQDSQIRQLLTGLQQLRDDPRAPAGLVSQVQQQGQTIDSINAFRKQINQELLRLREQLNSLQLAVPARPGG